MEAEQTPSFWHRHEFLILRLHSLSGLIPVGAYMVVHLLVNASVLDSAAKFQSSVYQIHSLGVILPLVEWVFIFIPIIFHAVVGVIIIGTGLPNTGAYRYGSNIRYTWQRATGMIAFVFIAWHVFHMHGWIHNDWWVTNIAEPGFGAQFKPYNAASSSAAAMQNIVVIVLYLIGVLASVFHLANGLWTMGITWGAWTTPAAQRRAGWVCGGFGALLTAVSIAALVGMYTLDIEQAREIENQMQKARIAAGDITEEQAKHKSSAEDHE